MSIWFFPLVIMILALVFTGLLRRYALSRSLMDIPNARSSHSVPTPRGGGVAIVWRMRSARHRGRGRGIPYSRPPPSLPSSLNPRAS